MLVKLMGPPPSLRRFIEVAKRFGAKVVEMNGYGPGGPDRLVAIVAPGNGSSQSVTVPSHLRDEDHIAASLFHNWRRRLGIPTDAFYDVSETRPS